MRRSRIGRYALWQGRDYVFERGIPAVIVGVLLLLPPIMASRAMRDLPPAMGGPDAEWAVGVLASIAEPFALFGALLATNGIVANDRRQGHFRFLFSKPVTITRYYLQAFVVHWIGLLAATAAVHGLFSATVHPVLVPQIFLLVSAIYLVFGGVAFAASALVRLDWVVAAALWGAGLVARMVWPPDEGVLGGALNVLLPPSHLAGDLQAALFDGVVPPATLAWFAAYGTGAVVAGWIALLRRPMAD